MNDKLPWHKRFVNFLKDVRSELKKVTWPAKQEVYGTTIIVIIAVFFFGIYLFFVDVVFSWLIAQVKTFFG
ncbi:MAG: preprotein translocase subunit SecE [Candidatus Saccharicenans sp.]|jgi:preprotein translocase subunit SecE|nr:preprotein translocase subunit SecE [Candidatus Saccharicenans sp.]MDH7575490.1 preprotein translocase subunit SecE [Candidatus Saccharicenans sp.]MDI6850286.1 preprotein translocase subunit SecE [Candidatus Saccharicenans sp.]NPV83720.1 preprotein translocase subunit SecE [Candidatus Aminicenantes bacterium]